jgi:hypothetical protein
MNPTSPAAFGLGFFGRRDIVSIVIGPTNRKNDTPNLNLNPEQRFFVMSYYDM